MSNQYIYGKFFEDLEKLPKEEIIDLMKSEHRFDVENSTPQRCLNELIYCGVCFDDILDHLNDHLPEKSNRQRKIKSILTVFISTLMDEDLYFVINYNLIKLPENYERLS